MQDLQPQSELFQRVVAILDNARANVVRSVNSNMVAAYWLIGREIVQEIQGGEDRAKYGKQVISDLSRRLLVRFQTGFSITNLQYFRKFYQAYSERMAIQHPTGAKYEMPAIRHPKGGESNTLSILSPAGRESGFHPHLGWSHYRALMRVEDAGARAFYEQEAAECGWSKAQLERQIRFEDEDFYVDLVFYNYLIKCFLLVDLKIGKLNHRDVGQMDGYVRLFEDRFKVEGDNPTIGLILCSDKSEAVAKYSVLSECRQIFASKYLQFLSTEQELSLEIEKERKAIEEGLAEKGRDAKEKD